MDFFATISSFIGPNKSIKFLLDGDQTEVVCCPAQYLANLPYQDSLSQYVNSAVQSHHEIHHQGTSTLLAFIYFFHNCIKESVKSGLNERDVFQELKTSLELCVKYLETKSYSLSDYILKSHKEKQEIVNRTVKVPKCKIFTTELPNTKISVNKLLLKSRYFNTFESDDDLADCEIGSNQPEFQLDESIHKQIEDVVKRVSHGNNELIPLLITAWSKQIELRKKRNDNLNFSFDVEQIHVLSILGKFSSSTVISGLVVPISQSLRNFVSEQRKRNALIISGNLKYDYKHRGYNQPIKSKIITTDVSSLKLSDRDIWMHDVLEKLQELNTTLLLVQGSVDDKFLDLCISSGVLVFGKMNAKTLNSVSKVNSIQMESYILDCDESNILRDVQLELWDLDGLKVDDTSYVKMELPTSFQTIVICSSCFPLLSTREHRALHFIHRLSSCLIKSIDGGGKAEKMCIDYLNRDSKDKILCQIFHNFVKYVDLNCSLGNEEVNPIDAFQPKIESWSNALNVAMCLASTEVVVLVGDQALLWKSVQQNPGYHFVGHL